MKRWEPKPTDINVDKLFREIQLQQGKSEGVQVLSAEATAELDAEIADQKKNLDAYRKAGDAGFVWDLADRVDQANVNARSALAKAEEEATARKRADGMADEFREQAREANVNARSALAKAEEEAAARKRADGMADEFREEARDLRIARDKASQAAASAIQIAPSDERPEDRRTRLAKKLKELKAQGLRDYSKRTANEEGISTVRLRQILAGSSASTRTPTASDPFGQVRKR